MFPASVATGRTAAWRGPDEWSSALRRPCREPLLRCLESSDAGNGFGGDGRSMHRVDIMKLAPGMSPAGDFIDVAATVEVMKSSVGIGLQRTPEVLQMHLGMLSLAIGRLGKPHGWRPVFASRPLIANVGQEASGPGLAVAGRKYRHRRVVGMDLAGG